MRNPDLAVLRICRAEEVSEYPLTQPLTTIGRSDDNQIVLSDDLVSRYHARLEWAEGAPCIADLGSTNGTLVNGTEIEPKVPYTLKESDIVSIGPFTLTLHPTRAGAREPVTVAGMGTVALPRRASPSCSPPRLA